MFGLTRTTETREHAPSYFAATAAWQTDYPVLEGEVQVDVAVVGGGFSGVNTALELAERGYTVALLEANRISWGATGRNGGQIIGGIGHSAEQFEKRIGEEGVRSIYRMGLEGCDIIRERVARYQIDCDIKWGYCDVALKPRHMKDFARWKAHEEKMGNPNEYELLDAEQVKAYVNSGQYCGGLLNRTGNGHIHPLNLCIGEARAAEQMGVKIYEQSRVTQISHGERPRVHTESGSVSASFVVLCGNAYMGDLVPGLAKRVLPAISSIIATAPLPEALARELMPADLAVCDPRTALDYFRLSADNRMLFGGQCNYTGLEPPDLVGTIRKKMENVFPSLAGIDIDYGWSGQMAIGLNRMPQLGRLASNVCYIQGYSGHGVAPSHIMARITAEMISGSPQRFDVFSSIPHRPFPGGRLLRRPAMAIGMLYFKLRDEL
jgi:glycine/D-amino acid oxidase-like deaminating enzyme